MTRKELIRAVRAHLRQTKESPYTFGRRVLHDRAFMWKLLNSERTPRRSTIRKIMGAIARREKRLEKIKSLHLKGVKL